MRYDVAIVGAGLAGCALATSLARRGRRVVLLEKQRFPRDKLCGEFLSPESQGELQTLGLLSQVQEVGPAPIRKARFTTESGAEIRFSLPGQGLGLSRWCLDAMLFAHAQASGAEGRVEYEVSRVRPGVQGELRVEGFDAARAPFSIQADWVVASHGRRARLDHALHRPFLQQRHPYLGLKRHHRARPSDAGAELSAALSDSVEIHAFEGGYCGMSFVQTGEVNVCMLLRQDGLTSGDEGGRYDWTSVQRRLLDRNPHLSERLRALEPSDEHTLAVSQVPFVPKTRCARGVVFVGDAAGMIAPLAGDGQAMALTSARLLATILAQAPAQPTASERAALGARWDARWRARFGLRLRVAQELQERLLSARTADRLVRGVCWVPGLAAGLARLTRE